MDDADQQGPQPEMSAAEALEQRFSCRGFLPAPVPPTTLRRIFELAQQAPSWCNSQAWQVTLLGGAERDAFSEALLTRAQAAPAAPDIPGPSSYDGVYRDRRRASGLALYEAVGIARDDQLRRLDQALENLRFFGAPHVAVVSAPRSLGVYGAVDCGAYVATLLTAAQSLGVATIAQAAIAMYADTVHDHLDIAADRDIVCAVSLGYADPAHPANSFRTDRAPTAEAVTGLR